MRVTGIAAVAAAGTILLSCGKQASESADIILAGGRIFTGGQEGFVEAVAVRGGRILATGTSQAVAARANSSTRRIDLGGRLVIPGLNDAHAHIDMVMPDHVALKLEGMDPPCAQVVAQLGAEAKRAPESSLLAGEIGPTAFFDSQCTPGMLEQIAPRHAAVLQTWSGHAAILNRKAAERFRIPVSAPPTGGFYGKDMQAGAWDGVVQEYARFRLAQSMGAEVNDDALRSRLSSFLRDAERYGITSVQTMSAEPDRLLKLLQEINPSVRVRVIPFPLLAMSEAAPVPTRKATGNLVFGGLKLILDGTPLERSMAMRQPYLDRPSFSGQLNLTPETIRRAVRSAAETDGQLLLHAVGDRTIELVLQAMQETGGPAEWPKRRLRLEHGDGLLADLIPRTKALGVVVVQNPSHLMLGDLLVRRLGLERAAQMQPFRTLVEAGVPFALGSDGPLNPFLNILFATTGPGNPKEALTRPQAVAAYTRGSAFAEFAEKEKGVLAPGMMADLAVLSQNIFVAPPPELPKTESVLTMIGGKIVRQTF